MAYVTLMHFSSKQANIFKLKKKIFKKSKQKKKERKKGKRGSLQYYFYPSKPSGQMLYRPSSLTECNL